MNDSFCLRKKEKLNESIAKSILLLPLYRDYSTAHRMLPMGDMVIYGQDKKEGQYYHD